MQRKTFTRTLLVAAALAVALPGLAQAQTMKLTLGHGAAPGNPRHEAAVKFAETLKAKTAGRIEVQVAPSAQLGDDAAMVTAVRTGALDMTANSQGAVSVAVPEYAAYGMPFMFSTPAQAFKLLDGPLVNIHASNLYEVQKHLALTSHMFQMTPFLMSKRTWDRLSNADRKAVTEAAAEATALQRKMSQEADDKLLGDLKAKGVQVTTVDKAAFGLEV